MWLIHLICFYLTLTRERKTMISEQCRAKSRPGQ